MTRTILTAVILLASAAHAADPYDALASLNRQRAARGLRPYLRDRALTRAAIAAAQFRARRGIAGHTANDFGFLPRGARAPMAGCAVRSPGEEFAACAAYEGWRYAGAGWCRGRNGRVFCHLFVR